MRKKIVFINMEFGPYFIPKLHELHRRLQASGYDMVVIESAGSTKLYGERQEETPDWWMRICCDDIYNGFMTALDKVYPDIVFSGAVAFTAGAAAVKWAGKSHRPVIVMDNVRRRNVSDNFVKNSLKRSFHLNADAVFLPSKHWQDDYEWWGFPKQRQFYGYNAIDNRRWVEWSLEMAGDLKNIRAKNRLPEKFFLGVGRHIAAKNWLNALMAYAEYCEQTPSQSWGFVFVGEGSLRRELESFAEQKKLKDVQFLPFVEPHKLAEYYSACSALLLPSINETWGSVVNECMCFAKPVLLSNKCGCSDDLLDDGINGYLFSPDDIGMMAEKMEQVTTIPEADLGAMGEGSREIVSGWGMDSFEKGVREAVSYCLEREKRYGPLVSRMLMPLWRGRYNPV